MTTETIDRPCGDADVLALPLSHGGHSGGGYFNGECCLVEKSNRIAFCIPEFRERYGAPLLALLAGAAPEAAAQLLA